MILDERTEMVDSLLLNTGAPARFLLGDQIDLGSVAGGDIGNGQDIYVVIQVEATATSAGAATAEFQLVSDAQVAIAVDGTATVHSSTGAIALANLTAGRRYVFQLPNEGVAYERYLGLLQVTGTAAFTGGRISAFLTFEPASWKAYPDAVN